MKFKLLSTQFIMLLALVLVPISTVHAQTPTNGGVFLFGQNYTLKEGETLNGSIAVFGGNIEIEKDAVVNGSIAIFGGNVTIAEGVSVVGDMAAFGTNMDISGKIEGDIVIFGGNAMLTADAVVEGNIATFGGQVNQEPGAEVTGTITNNTPPNIDIPQLPSAPNPPGIPNFEFYANPLWEVINTFGRAVAVAVIGMLLALFLQPQLDRASSVFLRQPVMAGGYGFLTLIILPVVIVILSITIILIPIALVTVLLIPLAWLFGMVVLGQEVGDRFAKAVNQVWAPVLSTGLGTFTLVLVTGLVNLVPCVGWLASFLVTLLAIGAAAVSRFGTYTPTGGGYTPPAPSVNEIPPAS